MIPGTLTAAVGIGNLAGAFLALALARPAVPAMYAAGSIFVARMWAAFFISWLFRVKGRPIRAGWERYAGVAPAAGETPVGSGAGRRPLAPALPLAYAAGMDAATPPMTPPNTPPVLDWRDGIIPVARAFGDPYFSLDGGLDETRHVFLAGNGLPGRFRDGFHIAETGFGTGLNLIAALAAWRASGLAGRFRFTSFEAHPMPRADAARALAAFPEVAGLTAEVLAAWGTAMDLPDASVRIVTGDVRDTLPPWDGVADAWFLDGFAPAKNPAMWEPKVMAGVARHTSPGGTFATYTAAGHVRTALAAAGFTVERQPGFGRKRHMTVGRM